MKHQMDNWLKEFQNITNSDKELSGNAGFCIAVFELVKVGIEDGGMRVRDRAESKKHITHFKDMIREDYQ